MKHTTGTRKIDRPDQHDDLNIDDLEMTTEELSDDLLEFVAGGMLSRPIQPTYRDGDPEFMDGCIP